MQRALVLFACVISSSCTESNGPLIGGEGGETFDPCGARPSPGFDPIAAGLAGCCSDGEAHCVPSEAVPAIVGANLSMCSTATGGGGLCLPDNAIRQGASYRPQQCNSSVGQARGVCLSRCIPRVANDPQSALLAPDGCRDDELCVPCINPISQQSTGACVLLEPRCGDGGAGSDDAGPAKCPYEGPPLIDPNTMPACAPACGGAHCVPATLVSPAQQTLLSSCSAAGGVPGLCAPDALIKTGGNFIPKSCRSVAGAEGRCVSQCLPSVAAQAAQLPIDVCGEGEKCAPCFNPVAADPNAATGACTIACDSPKEPPLVISCPWTGPPLTDPATFPACSPACGGSHCVPAANVPPAQQPLLAQCPGGFCTPDTFIKTGGKLIPNKCTSIAGVEGRCLSTCLPPVAADAALLPRDTCASDERCAPCFNPLAADPKAATGACTLGCDQPSEPPQTLMCPWTGPPIVDPALFPACACGKTRCLPANKVPSDQQKLLEPCPGGFCAPEDFIKTGGNLIPKSCTSVAGAEGRCLSACLPPIAAQAAQLPQDVCAAGEKCAPCFNPTASDPNAATGACDIGCDAPKKPPLVLTCPWTGPAVTNPASFPSCGPACGGAHCVPAAQVPAAQQALLASCTGGFCVPDPIIASANNYVPPTCTSVAGAEGRCVSTCLPAVAAQAAQLPQSTCAAGTKCAPCFNPTAANPNAPTGACSLGCDKPTKPPVIITCPWSGPAVTDPATFPSCSPACAGAHCVPTAQVPAAQQGLLATCSGGFCVPDQMISSGGQGVPSTCTSVAGAEGRCVSTCLPSVKAQASLLPQGTCPANTKCAPCFDPTAANPSAATGACTIACDKPTKAAVILKCPWNGPAVVDPQAFPQCPSCGGARCVPAARVPASLQSQLASCSGGFCVPDKMVAGAGYTVPPACTPFANAPAEGRCLSPCLPAVAAKASQLRRDVCSSAELCVPCFDPFTGASTGACTTACDKPVAAPWKFPKCCVGDSTCVPAAQVPGGQADKLNQLTCPSGFLCAPDAYLPGNSPWTCSAGLLGLQRGTCVSRCVNLGIGGIFQQKECPNNHACVPCLVAPAGTPGC